MIFLKQTWSFHFLEWNPAVPTPTCRVKCRNPGPYFGKPVLSGWPFVMTVSGYFMGCDVHKLDRRVLWEPAVILPVFLPTLLECKCGIAMLLQEKSSWSKSTLFASIDSLTGFGNESPVRPRTPYLCVGMLGWGAGSCFAASSERGGRSRVVECLANAAKVDWGLTHRFYLLVKNMSILVVMMTCRKWMLLLCCDLVVDLVWICAL